jgi:hypothetical protein
LAAVKKLIEGDETVAIAALQREDVVPLVDRVGRVGFAPVDREKTRLSDRILSLLCADFLARPDDYEGLVEVCEPCQAISFSSALYHVTDCDARCQSGVRIRGSEEVQASGEVAVRPTLHGIG